MELDLTGSTAIVVGGASGIGLAIAKAFAREGAGMILIDRNPHVTTVAAENVGKSGPAEGIVADVCDATALKQAAERVAAQYGRGPMHMIYAAGCGSGKFGFPFWNLEPADWEGVLRVNLIGAVNAAHAFGPHLSCAGRGTMLFISSVAGQIGSQTDPPYSAAKAGLINFAQCAAKDLAPRKVRVNTICPGMVQTPLNKSVWQSWHDLQPEDKRQSYEDWGAEKIQKLTPLNRWQKPEDIANLAVFLASDRAENITGQTMNVDGGWVMHW